MVAQVIGHLTLGEAVGWLPQQRCEVLAEMLRWKSPWAGVGTARGHARELVPQDRKCGGALGCHLHWTIDFLKGFFGEDANVADALYLQQSSLGLKSDTP